MLSECQAVLQEAQDASLLQRSAGLEHEQKALGQQVQLLQCDLDQEHQPACSKGDQGQQTDPQAAAPGIWSAGSCSREPGGRQC